MLKEVKDLILASTALNLVLPISALLFLNLGLCILNYYGYTLNHSDSPLINALSLTVGLLLAFRNSTSYFRYWEGRTLWTQIHQASRNLAKGLAIQVGNKKSPATEKRIIISRIILLSYKIKDQLRQEVNNVREHSLGYWLQDSEVTDRQDFDNENDLKDEVLKNAKFSLGKMSAVVRPEIVLPKEELEIKITTKPEETRKSLSQPTPLPPIPTMRRSRSSISRGPNDQEYGIVELLLTIDEYINKNTRIGNLDSNQSSLISGYLSQISNASINCQRIARTPIPPAYSIHLNIMVAMYCLSLPFSIVSTLGFYSILVSFVVFYVLIGIHNIAMELENPFGFQYNDLPLEQYCLNIREDVEGIMAQLSYQEDIVKSVNQFSRFLLPNESVSFEK